MEFDAKIAKKIITSKRCPICGMGHLIIKQLYQKYYPRCSLCNFALNPNDDIESAYTEWQYFDYGTKNLQKLIQYRLAVDEKNILQNNLIIIKVIISNYTKNG